MKACYFDPRSERTVEVEVHTPADVYGLLDGTAALASGRGRPTVELRDDDGASLSVSTDGHRAFLVWVVRADRSYHSVGGVGEEVLVFDYGGSWSEAPPEHLVPIDDVRESVRAFLAGLPPATAKVPFEPD